MNNALIIFFNTDFSKNIPALERIYGSRFADILYIVPDHVSRLRAPYFNPDVSYQWVNNLDKGLNRARRVLGKTNRFELTDTSYQQKIVRITGIQYFFQDYFWQARKCIAEMNAQWYWFVSDDVLINQYYNEKNIDSILAQQTDQSIIAAPHHPSTAWVDWFQKSTDSAVDKLRLCQCYPDNIESLSFENDSKNTGPYQENILAGCADIFAIHHSKLELFFELCHLTALAKLFVELAIPNILLSHCSPVTFVNDYVWDFEFDKGNWDKIEKFLVSDSFFYHPVKLSMLSEKQLSQLT